MIAESMEKISGGKLLRVRIDFDKKINNVQIIGDFFAHPEDCIGLIEEKFIDLPLDFENESQIKLLNEFILENNYQIIGFSIENLIELIKRALEK
ncbi:biotin--protein ligase [archaeon]|jgi:hypothetical protein|nr:biotin--protein ligase [archaeon]